MEHSTHVFDNSFYMCESMRLNICYFAFGFTIQSLKGYGLIVEMPWEITVTKTTESALQLKSRAMTIIALSGDIRERVG